jgi:hypothetical protein
MTQASNRGNAIEAAGSLFRLCRHQVGADELPNN